MRIATLNVWNNPSSWFERMDAICAEVAQVDPDVLAIQEVRTYLAGEDGMDVAQHIANETGFPFCVFKAYPDSPDEGLAFLSKFPLRTAEAIWQTSTQEADYCAIRVTFEAEGAVFGMTNVHLNWRSAAIREQQMRAVLDWISEEGRAQPHEILCGDFNDDPDSPVHQYLTDHRWSDAARLHEDEHGVKAPPTLDHVNNPHLHTSDPKTPSRYDWILLKAQEDLHFLLQGVELFGNTPVTGAKILPSDHYGVFADLIIEHEKETDRASS